MDRREALKITSIFLGGTIIGSGYFISGCALDEASGEFLSEAEIHFLNEVGETILPETKRSPGAKAANVGAFMHTFVRDCYSPEEQEIFKAGIEKLNHRAKAAYSANFIDVQPEQKFKLLVKIDQEAEKANLHYFTMFKQLSILGYFTSRPGATQALRYNPVPGEFIGCIPYQEGDKAFAGRV
ncbi:gluconate 2-dehydrogenase subunit 3 family protein [Gramella sp. AN32]|uniref:Gluconate 2-dehydrogenase subunit 3 family protein n=1 Tax=Christiangramia antarctica TaxID=2058158 RepID=A0ABW5X2P9_9FLAO|nr:gluconate 2-dehydrogenase subunit 3 family protein [Gramella sp. AN32]MCM4157717.1 twin-arginine translocation pathway signal protein [Gramella sp. AN32]